MKRLTAATGALLLALLLGRAAKGQTASFQVHIPFKFVVGHSTLSAGSYVFERLLGKPTSQDSIGIIVVRSTRQHLYRSIVTALAAQPPESQNSASKIVFRRIQGKHYLDQLWVSGDKAVHVLTTVPRGQGTSMQSSATEEIPMETMR